MLRAVFPHGAGRMGGQSWSYVACWQHVPEEAGLVLCNAFFPILVFCADRGIIFQLGYAMHEFCNFTMSLTDLGRFDLSRGRKVAGRF